MLRCQSVITPDATRIKDGSSPQQSLPCNILFCGGEEIEEEGYTFQGYREDKGFPFRKNTRMLFLCEKDGGGLNEPSLTYNTTHSSAENVIIGCSLANEGCNGGGGGGGGDADG